MRVSNFELVIRKHATLQPNSACLWKFKDWSRFAKTFIFFQLFFHCKRKVPFLLQDANHLLITIEELGWGPWSWYGCSRCMDTSPAVPIHLFVSQLPGANVLSAWVHPHRSLHVTLTEDTCHAHAQEQSASQHLQLKPKAHSQEMQGKKLQGPATRQQQEQVLLSHGTSSVHGGASWEG
eukprot:scaffold310970_cov17-Tisochrysis_lutea.AAC.1